MSSRSIAFRYIGIPLLIVALANLYGLAIAAGEPPSVWQLVGLVLVASFTALVLLAIAAPKSIEPKDRGLDEGLIEIVSRSRVLRVFRPVVAWLVGAFSRSNLARHFASLVTFILGIAGLLVLLFGVCVVLVIPVWLGRIFLESEFFRESNFYVYLTLALLIMQSALHESARTQLSWKKLNEFWLKVPGVSAMSTGGLAMIPLATSSNSDSIQKKTLESPYVDLDLIMIVAIFGVATMLIAKFLAILGNSRSGDEDGREPAGWFYVVFGFAFLSGLALHPLLLHSITLTALSYTAG